MKVSLVAAMSADRVIGRGNALPWKLPADLKRFKSLTMGRTIVMGRKTFESIGRALPGRRTIVVTRQPEWLADGATVARSMDEAFRVAEGDEEVFVVGGGEIYRQTIARADRLFVTVVEGRFEGDAWFPPIDPAAWSLESEEKQGPVGEAPGHVFRIYLRTSGSGSLTNEDR
jgi:dihydrofolate reductase